MLVRRQWKIVSRIRNFSKMSIVEKYSLKVHKEKYIKKKMLESEDAPPVKKNELEERNYIQRKLDTTFYPKQHPKNLDFQDTSIISWKPPVRNLAKFYKLPLEALEFNEEPFTSPPDSKSVDVCIIGAPNAGKSLLFNQLIGKTVSAVSNKSYTTDNSVLGVYTDLPTKTQLCLHDTPGATKAFNNSKSSLLVTRAWETIEDCDKVIFVADAVKHVNTAIKDAVKRLRNSTRTTSEQRFLDRIKASRDDGDIPLPSELKKEFLEIAEQDEDLPAQVPSVLVINKMDLVTNKSKTKMRELQHELEDLGQFEKTLFVSALTGFGMDELKKYLLGNAKNRPWEYHPNTKSTQSEVEKVGEILRQEIFKKYFEELPFKIIIKVMSWVPRSNGELIVDYQIDTHTAQQRGIILGEKGRILRDVRESCQAELCKLLNRPVRINIKVFHNPSGLRQIP